MPHTPKRGRGGGRGGRGGFSRFSGQGNVLGGTSGTSSPRGSPFPFRGGRGGGRGRGGALSVQGQNAVGFDYSAIAIRGQEDSEEDFVIEPPKGYVHQARPHLDSAEAASNANASPRPGPSQPNSGTATPTDTQHGATVIPIGPRVGSPYTIRGGTRGRGRGGFSAAPVFPSFVTSRGATSGRSASGGLGFRPLPQTEDEQYLAGVPGKGQRARGSSARSGDPADERPLLRPVEFVKSTGDWDNGRFRMHGEKATDAAEDESATQGYEHEETMPPYEHTTTTTEEIAEQALGQQSGSIVEDGEDEALIESLLQAYPGSRELGADEELDSTTQAVISMAPAPDAPQLSVPNGDDSSSLPTLQEDAIHVHDVEMESDAPVASTESAAGTSQMMLSSRPHTPLAVHITTESYTSSEPGTLRGRPRSTSSVSVGHTTHAHSTAAASGASSDAVTPLSQHPGLGSAQQHASSAMNGFGSQPPGQLGSELVNGLGSADMPDTEQSPRAVALEEHGQGADDLGFVIDTVGDHTLAERQSLETNTQSSAPIHRPGGFVLGDTTPVNERGTSRRGRIAPHGLASTHAPAPAPVRAAPTTPSVSQPKPALNHQESEDEDEEIILIPRSSQQPQHQVQLHHQQSGAQWRSAPGVSSDTDEERQLDAILEQARSQGGRLGLGATPVSIEHATATATIDLTGSPPPPDSEASARNFASVNGTLESASALAKDAERNDQESGDDDVNWTERQPRGEGKKRRNAAKKARRRQRAKGSADAAGAKPPVPREGDSDLEWGSDGPPGGRRAAASEARESGNKLGAGDVDDVQMRALSICSDLPATRDEEERMTRAALEASLRDDAELNALASKAGRAREEKASGAAAQGLTAAQKAAKNKMRGGARAKRTMPSISLRVKAEKDKDRARANALSRREEELVILADYMENALGNNSDTEEDSDVVVERGAGAALNGKEDEPTEMDEMLNFMRGMDAGGGGRHVTIDDIEDARRIREEDEEMRDGADRGSSDEWLTEESDEGEDDGEEDGRGDKSKRAKRSASVSGEEDEEEDDSEDDDDDLEDAELAAALDAAERLVVDGSEAESESTDEDSGSDEDEDSSFDDEGQHPHSGIGMQRATVARGRGGKGGKKKGKGKGKGRQYDESESEESDEDENEEGMFNGNFSWAAEDEEFINSLERFVQDNDEIVNGRDRKARNRLFKAIERGDFGSLADDDMVIDPVFGMGSMPAAKRGKDKKKTWKSSDPFADELQMQWEKDRETKAANKRKRALARQEAALSPYPNTHKKGGKKAAKKAARTAARQGRGGRRFDDSDSDAATLFEAPQATARKATNLRELNAQIGEFLADADRTTLVLPAMEKRARAQVHMLADAYNLKSKSRGKGHTRFPTLLKNSRSGLNVDRTRVARILGGHGNDGFGSGGGGGAGWKDRAGAKGKGKTATHGGALAPRNRDGTEVGWGAEKIKADNVGHRLLSMMGWTEGTGIGLSAGIDQPVSALVKISKGGLGF